MLTQDDGQLALSFLGIIVRRHGISVLEEIYTGPWSLQDTTKEVICGTDMRLVHGNRGIALTIME